MARGRGEVIEILAVGRFIRFIRFYKVYVCLSLVSVGDVFFSCVFFVVWSADRWSDLLVWPGTVGRRV